MYLFLAFLLVPLIEIALFIQVGGLIGLWPTLAIVIVTAVAGASLVRSQGIAALTRVRASIHDLSDPSRALADGAMILFAGALLLTPGFFTDIVGFLLLLPPVRGFVFDRIRARINVQHFATAPDAQAAKRGDVIDGTWEDVSEKRRNHPPSGWTQDRPTKD